MFYETWHRGNDCQPPHPSGILKINAAVERKANPGRKEPSGAEESGRGGEKKVLIANRAEELSRQIETEKWIKVESYENKLN